jgi:hypothetical protein
MKIALIAGGQPRFTPDFITFMNQLHGFDRADLYFSFWNSDWANSEHEGCSKIEKILLPKYQLAKLQLIDQPEYEMPPCTIDHPPPMPENIRWNWRRKIGQWKSMQMAFNLIDQNYDIVIRFRLDGRLYDPLDLKTLDLTNNELLLQDYGRAGFDDYRINDQFAVGNYAGIRFFVDLADHFRNLVPECDPNWEYNNHGNWSSEHILGAYMKKHNKKQVFGNFKFHINWSGRSRFTDKHYHHPISQDPTSL